MALIKCPDCQGEVSDQAAACPRCGHPIATTARPAAAAQGGVDTARILDAKLNEAAAMARQRGGRIVVDSRSSAEAIFTFVQTPNHVLHGLLSVVTAGLWLIVWLVIAANGGKKKTWKIKVEANGDTTVAQI